MSLTNNAIALSTTRGHSFLYWMDVCQCKHSRLLINLIEQFKACRKTLSGVKLWYETGTVKVKGHALVWEAQKRCHWDCSRTEGLKSGAAQPAVCVFSGCDSASHRDSHKYRAFHRFSRGVVWVIFHTEQPRYSLICSVSALKNLEEETKQQKEYWNREYLFTLLWIEAGFNPVDIHWLSFAGDSAKNPRGKVHAHRQGKGDERRRRQILPDESGVMRWPDERMERQCSVRELKADPV